MPAQMWSVNWHARRLAMLTSAIIGALRRGIVDRVGGCVDELHGGGVGEGAAEGGSLARSGEGRERNGAGARFSVFSTPICKQCTSSQSIRWRPDRQVDICGVYAQVSSPNVIALVPFWTGLPIARPTASTAGVGRICAAIRWERVLAAAAPVRPGGG